MTTDSKREKIAEYARDAVRRTVFGAVRDTGGQLIDRLITDQHPDWGTTRDATPADGLMAARAIENAARRQVGDYIRAAREDGMSWAKIGKLLGLEANARATDEHAADLAFTIAAGPSDDRDYLWRDRYCSWRCRDCGELISDFGPDSYPEPGRGGHKDGCKRLAVERRHYSAYEKGRDR